MGLIGATLLIVALLLFAASYEGFVSFSSVPKTQGRGAGQSGNYAGTVTISSRESTSDVFDLTWNITSGQMQLGVGILVGDVLSVSYYETDASSSIKDIGVVSYRVIDGQHLQGQWSSVQGGTAGVEELTLQPRI
jgi:hypothetical protein